jgi:UDP-2-acetamido-3-amino-2,3-dideoxy-glucuronate N-acetyltransferase
MAAEMAKIGVIGVGYWGKNLARNLNDLEELAAICDDNPNNLDTVGRDYPNVKRYSDITEMLADPDIGAVAVATPAATHGSVTRQALNARKHVFVEKPLCLDIEEAGELKLLADRQNRTLMVGHMMLYHPAFQSLLNTVRDAALYEGEITVLNQAAEVECAILEGFLGRRKPSSAATGSSRVRSTDSRKNS